MVLPSSRLAETPMSQLPPDRLSAEARRWFHGRGYGTDPVIVAAALDGLERHYDDVQVLRGLPLFWPEQAPAQQTLELAS